MTELEQAIEEVKMVMQRPQGKNRRGEGKPMESGETRTMKSGKGEEGRSGAK